MSHLAHLSFRRLWVVSALLAVAQSGTALAQSPEQGRVLSATAVTQPVAVQRQVCPVEPGGACTMQTFQEMRAVAYDVVYEYAGKQFSVQMPHDPGPFVQLQVAAVVPQPGAAPVVSAPALSTPATTVVSTVSPAPVVVAPAPTVVYTTPYPYYWGPSYVYPPVGVSLRFGYWGGGHRRWR